MNNILFRFKFDYKHTGHHRDCKEVCFWKKTKPWAFRDISGGACTRRGELNAAPPPFFPFPQDAKSSDTKVSGLKHICEVLRAQHI